MDSLPPPPPPLPSSEGRPPAPKSLLNDKVVVDVIVVIWDSVMPLLALETPKVDEDVKVSGKKSSS
jgi:hypothetical protein